MRKNISPENLTFEQFSSANRARCEAEDGFNHQLADWTPSEWLAACVGELGEVAHVVKTIIRQRDNLVSSEIEDIELKRMLAEEIADTVIYLDLLAQSQEINLSDAIAEKFNKKSKEIGSQTLL
ncbi:MazG nucleotide pyrophosphohydrolase domain-containing protein [Hoeflea poritis]|uniref:NTP pyrophosphohydrolase MazG-like domain-containing protein n=1 Tax=Hoeflea poritis TaxID=2993659 RepID=A0ABT4VKK7_9HYPH|nr:MazG nucleotide pyrophosphohydrolase domain-containing protein [Hoeflea poritis]MDA4845254.1 hypothetical protein [Hoeflea poritis]